MPGWRNEPVLGTARLRVARASPLDLPVMIVQQQVMALTEQNAVPDVGSPAISIPVVDVMRLRPGWRSFAARPHASAIALRQGGSLPRGEEPLLTADIERLTVVVKEDRDDPLRAGDPLDGFDRDGEPARALQAAMAGAGAES